MSHVSPENRAKSPSVEHNVSPCSIASAARCASGTRLPYTPGKASKSPSTAACRSVGAGIHTVSADNHVDTCCHATAIVRGLRKALGFVAIRRNASKVGQGNPTGTVPPNLPSSQARLLACWPDFNIARVKENIDVHQDHLKPSPSRQASTSATLSILISGSPIRNARVRNDPGFFGGALMSRNPRRSASLTTFLQVSVTCTPQTLELHSHIVVEGQCRSHASTHISHDVLMSN